MKVALLGDIAFFGKYSIKNNEILDYFKDVANTLKEYDYVVGNLETPFCESNTPEGYKSAFIKSDIGNVQLLKYLNIDAVNLSNNHIFDYGNDGYNSTKKVLKENSIPYFGIENKQLFVKKNNNKIAFSGYCCYSTNGLGYYNSKTNKGINILDGNEIEKKLTKNDEEGFFNITSLHFGQEHINYPNYDHIELARKLASKIPYVFYGHHPHVMQGIENINESLIAYSLGNFCFDDVYTDKSSEPLVKQTEENKKSFILVLEIQNNKVIDYETVPLYAGDKKMTIGNNPEIISEIKEYSSYLEMNKEEYSHQRNKSINLFINKRKLKRDFNWYFKRLNIRTVGIILDLYKNKKLYKKHVKDYIN